MTLKMAPRLSSVSFERNIWRSLRDRMCEELECVFVCCASWSPLSFDRTPRAVSLKQSFICRRMARPRSQLICSTGNRGSLVILEVVTLWPTEQLRIRGQSLLERTPERKWIIIHVILPFFSGFSTFPGTILEIDVDLKGFFGGEGISNSQPVWYQ
jgi:hypothetical protein